jgi:hypothetical protein
MMRSIAAMSLCLVMTACDDPEPPQLSPDVARQITGIIRVSDLVARSASDTVVLDLQSSRDAYWIEPGQDPSAIEIMRASGRTTSLEQWMVGFAADPRIDPIDMEGGVLVFSSAILPSESKNCMPVVCVSSSDGSVACMCLGGP